METLPHRTNNPYYPARPAASPQSRSVNLIGAGFDGTACFRKGASAGPDAFPHADTRMPKSIGTP